MTAELSQHKVLEQINKKFNQSGTHVFLYIKYTVSLLKKRENYAI